VNKKGCLQLQKPLQAVVQEANKKKTILFLYRAIRENESKHMPVVDGSVGHGKQMAQIARVVLFVGSAHRD
jgi:hypothetical protein